MFGAPSLSRYVRAALVHSSCSRPLHALETTDCCNNPPLRHAHLLAIITALCSRYTPHHYYAAVCDGVISGKLSAGLTEIIEFSHGGMAEYLDNDLLCGLEKRITLGAFDITKTLSSS